VSKRLSNPPNNQLRAGTSMDQLRAAVEKSGYPLQTEISELLGRSFWTQDEWSYVDRDSGELRAIDIRADRRLYDQNTEPRARPQLTVLVECKHSLLPYVFFESKAPSGMVDHPRIAGLHKPMIRISSDDDPSTWTFTVIHALNLHEHAFQTAPVFCNTFSKATRKGSELELSGTEAYSGLVLPLIKALDHLLAAEALPKTAWYFDAHLAIALGVLDAPMVVARKQPTGTTLELVPWVRVLRHEFASGAEFGERDRMWAVDVVHQDYLEEYVSSHLMPFANDFATRVLAHTTEIADGQAFVAGMGANSWHGIEPRVSPARLSDVTKRAGAVGRNLVRAIKTKTRQKVHVSETLRHAASNRFGPESRPQVHPQND
jgi:hypothetical protein